MDVYTVTFVYPRPEQNSQIPGLYLVDGPNDGPSFETVHGLCMTAIAQFQVNVTFWQVQPPAQPGAALQDENASATPKAFGFMITGAYASVLAARGFLLRECPVVTRTSIPIPRSEILDAPSPLAQPSLKPAVRRRLDEVASQTLAHIAVVNPSSNSSPSSAVLPGPALRHGNGGTSSTPFPVNPFPSSSFSAAPGSLPATIPTNSTGGSIVTTTALEPEPMCHIVVTGSSTAPSIAKVRLLVMLDELAGLHSEAIEIDYKLHPIIAGRKRATIQSIQEETATNIYMPEQLKGMIGGASAIPPQPAGRKNENTIWITGEFFGVQRARDMLFQLAHTKGKSVFSRDCAILPRKLDWMLIERLKELKTIMSDNATYLEFPPLGSQTSVVSIYGDERVNIHRSIRAIMLLATHHLSAQFYLLPTHFNLLLPSTTINPTQIPPLLKHLALMTGGGSEIVFRDNCFEFYGGEQDVRRGVASVGEIGIVKTFHHEIRFQLELANEHRDFISGKKNGKINKIMQLTGCRIRFETLTASPPIPSSGSSMLSPSTSTGSNLSVHSARSGPPSPTKPGTYGQSPPQPAFTPGTGGFGPPIQTSPSISIQQATPNPNSPTTPTSAYPNSQPSPQGMSPPSALPTSSAINSVTNFLITLSGSTLAESLQGLNMLLEELPAEISFHVPESYHKRIIGVGGRTIQRIMKKYGVFVKFFNGNAGAVPPRPGEDLDDGPNAKSTGGPNAADDSEGVSALALGDAEDNVVARTPAKNAINLDNLKSAVLEMVNPKDKDYTYETVSIPRRYHRILQGEKGIFIKDIESKTGSKVRFPDKETASDVVTIYGPESQVHIATARLQDHVPFEADMNIPNHPELASIIMSQDFVAFSERIKRDYQIVIIPRLPPSSGGTTVTSSRDALRRGGSNGTSIMSHKSQSTSSISSISTDDAPVATFKFRCQRSNSDLLATARDALETFLASKGIMIGAPSIPPAGVSPSSTYSLSGSLGNGPTATSSSVGMGLGNGLSDFKHRRADSFADAFPHFNSKLLSTAGSDSHRTLLSRRIRMATSSPDVKALFNSHSHSHSPSQVYKLPEHDEQDDAGFQAPSQEGNEYYRPPPRIRHAPSISFLPGFREHSDEVFQRGSDGRLQEKLKDQNKQRSLTNRAQSLDLTSLSRPDRLSAVRVPSPVDSTNPSSPTSASASTPSFPSVNGPAASSHNGHPHATHYTHQNHYSFPNATYSLPSYGHQHHLSYSRPRTQVSLSSSSSSLSLSSAIEQPAAETDHDADASVMDDVSRVISQIRLDSLH
ncbi:hypothetical protein FS837_002629 [Tulasnella sp. UAMH 9824]|nr:hypothetical protein FS837_002629 [Tulasnella sp. UAMH 9824]